MRRSLTTAVLTLLAAGFFIAGVILVGRYFRSQLKDDPRYQFPVSDIECTPPPGQDRVTFLSEVQYLAELPDEVPLFDEGLPRRLREAFAQHAWVEAVEEVDVGPGRRIRIALRFRTPLLAVRLGDAWRCVDANAVLLPQEASTDGLPRLVESPPPPPGPGRRWGHAAVEQAAQIAALLLPLREQAPVQELERVNGVWRLRLTEARLVVWGSAPGAELENEARAPAKIEQLRSMTPIINAVDLRQPISR